MKDGQNRRRSGVLWRYIMPAIEMAERTDSLNYIAFDCLSELTLAILQKDKRRDPARGFALDMLALMPRILPIAKQRRIRLITNGGGINPLAARDAIASIARKARLKRVARGSCYG